MAAVIDAGRH